VNAVRTAISAVARPRCAFWINRAVVRLNCADEAQRDVTFDRFVDGPQCGADRVPRAVDADDHGRRCWLCVSHFGIPSQLVSCHVRCSECPASGQKVPSSPSLVLANQCSDDG
jgi:hypothetical protein